MPIPLLLAPLLATFAQMQNPELIPGKIKDKLKNIGLWDLHPLNLFRITWKNEPKETGGLYGVPNFIELPRALTGIDARIIVMLGKWFPTGAHKVGAATDAWPRVSSPVVSIPLTIKPCGHQPGTIVAVARSIPISWM